MGLGGGSLPTGTHKTGSSRCLLGEVLSEDLCAWGKEERDPLQSGSLPVASWQGIGGWGPGFYSGSATLCPETTERKTTSELSGPHLFILQTKPRGRRNLSRSTQLVG